MVSARQDLSLSQSHSVAPLQTLELEWRCTHDFFLHPVFLLVFLGAVQSVQIRRISPGQKWPGFSFALHPTRCRAFILSLYNTAPYKRLQRVLYCLCKLYHPRHKTARRALQALFLRFAPFCRHKYQTDTSGYNTTCATLGHCTGQCSRLIIIRYIRVQGRAPVIDPCQTAQHIADHASPAACNLAPGQQSGRTGWHPPPGGAVQQQGRGGRRGTIDGYRRISFRAFAR